MHTLLQLNTSLYSENGHSSRLAQDFVDRWRSRHPEGRVLVRDLAREPVPHLTAEAFCGFATKPAERTPAQQAAVALSDRLIEELRQAHLIVLGLPMYNFGVPSTLKAYFDHVARAGITFRYTDQGPEGLLAGKRAVVFTTRGGSYTGPDDTEVRYVEQFLNFLGIGPVAFVYAQGLAIDPATREAALARARECTEHLLGRALTAA